MVIFSIFKIYVEIIGQNYAIVDFVIGCLQILGLNFVIMKKSIMNCLNPETVCRIVCKASYFFRYVLSYNNDLSLLLALYSLASLCNSFRKAYNGFLINIVN